MFFFEMSETKPIGTIIIENKRNNILCEFPWFYFDRDQLLLKNYSFISNFWIIHYDSRDQTFFEELLHTNTTPIYFFGNEINFHIVLIHI